MGRMCGVCGGLVPAPGEVLGYSGPLCNGWHGNSYFNNAELFARVNELEKRVQELSQQDTRSTTKAKGKVLKNANRDSL